MKLQFAALLVVAQLVAFPVAGADRNGGEHWVVTWATAEMLVRPTPPAAPAQPAAQQAQAPAQKAAPAAPKFYNQTVRMMVRTSIGGQRLRIRVSNAFGSTPVVLGAAHVAVRAKDSEIVAGTDRALTFSGKPGATLGPGMLLTSDPVDLKFAPLADLAVSLYFPGDTGAITNHGTGLHNTYIMEGDATGAASMHDARMTTQYYWLSAVDVLAPASAAALVTLGDSITDGAVSQVETNHSWPALLAARLAANKTTAEIGVANAGIGGNRVLRDNTGASAIARFDRDVLSQAGVKWVMFLEGINDIGHGADVPTESVTAEDLIAGHKQIITLAHTHGLKIIGCTLTPYEGAKYARDAGEAVREALNQWIRTGGAYDAVVDFDAATRDAASPKRIRAEFDPGDHLHPNNNGYEAMANAVDLSIFGAKPVGKPAKAAKK